MISIWYKILNYEINSWKLIIKNEEIKLKYNAIKISMECILVTWLKTYKYQQKQINVEATSKQIWHATTNNQTNSVRPFFREIKINFY